MQFSGTEEIAAPREVTWAFLMDPNKVGSCGPGVQSIDVVDDDHFNARAKVGVGFITATFNVHMTFVERVPLELARISARGQAPGSAVDAIGEMRVRDGNNGTTIMDWSADVNISGTLASVGARLIEGTAHKLIGQTFTCIKTKLQDEAVAAAAQPAEAQPSVAEPDDAAARSASADLSSAQPTSSSAPEASAADSQPAADAAVEGEEAAAPAAAPTQATAPGSAAPDAPAAPRHRGGLEFLIGVIGPAMTNVYVIADPATREAIVIDPARPCLDWLSGQLKARDWALKLIVVTHGHWDHVGDVAAVQQWSAGGTEGSGAGAHIAVHALDSDLLATPSARTAPFEVTPVIPAVNLADGDHIVFGSIDLEVLHTPGHTRGSVCLRTGTGGVLFSGDTLAAGSWGRVDLPGGSPADMVASLRRLAALPDSVRVLPGHGRSTTIGQERHWLDLIAQVGALVD